MSVVQRVHCQYPKENVLHKLLQPLSQHHLSHSNSSDPEQGDVHLEQGQEKNDSQNIRSPLLQNLDREKISFGFFILGFDGTIHKMMFWALIFWACINVL